MIISYKSILVSKSFETKSVSTSKGLLKLKFLSNFEMVILKIRKTSSELKKSSFSESI